MSAVEKPLFSTGFPSLVRPWVSPRLGNPNPSTLPFWLSYRVRIPGKILPVDNFTWHWEYALGSLHFSYLIVEHIIQPGRESKHVGIRRRYSSNLHHRQASARRIRALLRTLYFSRSKRGHS